MKEAIFDLTIVGGGTSGVCAAITAARHGMHVALIEARDVLGGNTSSECRVHYNGSGDASNSFYGRESGLSDELKLTISHRNPRYNFKDDYHLSDMAIYQMVIDEENIELFLGTYVYGAECENGSVISVKARKWRTEEEIKFISPLFADASGDGILASLAGAEYRYGTEARSEFSEDLAPERATEDTMGSCILFTVGKADRPVPYVKPPFAYDYKKDGILAFCEREHTGRKLPRKLDGVTGIWWLSYGGTLDPIKDDDNIDHELKRLVYGFWDYVKNSGDYEGVENYYLSWVGSHLAKRESRRFISDYILTQNDITNQTEFYDSVSTGGWWLDIHDPEGVYGNSLTSRFGEIHGLYNIPYRIMYSRNISNLFLLGRIVSATHVALGSIRVMQTLSAMASAAAGAAVLCKKYGLLPRDISAPEYISELQCMLQRDGQYISGIKEDVGIASDARISASSICKFENETNDKCEPLDKEYVLALPAPEKRLDRVDIGIRNLSDEDRVIHVHIYSAYKNDSYEIASTVERMSINVPGGFDGYLPVIPQSAIFKNNVALVGLLPSEDISIYTSERYFSGAPTFIAADGRIARRFTYFTPPKTTRYASIAFRSLEPSADLFAPKNVVNGISRPLALPNMWRAPIKDNPYLDLDFDDPKDVSEIQIIFNPMLQYDHFSDPIEALVKSYTLEVEHEEGIYSFAEDNNYLALLRHKVKLSGVRRIRFTFRETYGLPYAEVFAVKVF